MTTVTGGHFVIYEALNRIFCDKRDGELFTLFSGGHFFFIALFAVMLVGMILLLKGKSREFKDKATLAVIGVGFGLYILDFFLMPFAYGVIEIEKLPFHICTLSCTLSFLSRHVGWMKKYRTHMAMLAFIANFCFLAVPAGVMWNGVTPTSYRAVQTLLFHAVCALYGLLMLIFDNDEFSWRFIYRDVIAVSAIVVWSMIGSYSYTGNVGGYNYYFNWFFVKQDPFNIFPANLAPYIMPVFIIVAFFAVESLIYGAVYLGKRYLVKNGDEK